MADIFDEIDEELKQDRAKQVWARYGKYALSAAAAVVLGIGASQRPVSTHSVLQSTRASVHMFPGGSALEHSESGHAGRMGAVHTSSRGSKNVSSFN